MKILVFAKRCLKEIVRDPLNLAFGLGFPIGILLLLSAMQSNIPVDIFKIESLAPGVGIFGLSFITLFSATLLSKDRESLLLQRLYTTPLTATDFILGYALPFIPIALVQSAVCYGIALLLGLAPSVNILLALLLSLPISFFYIALGLLCGSALNSKQVGGLCGALLTNLSAWLSGVWFDLSLLGSWFETLAKCLPFYYAVELERAVICANFSAVWGYLHPIIIFAVLTTATAVLVFLRQMKD